MRKGVEGRIVCTPHNYKCPQHPTCMCRLLCTAPNPECPQRLTYLAISVQRLTTQGYPVQRLSLECPPCHTGEGMGTRCRFHAVAARAGAAGCSVQHLLPEPRSHSRCCCRRTPGSDLCLSLLTPSAYHCSLFRPLPITAHRTSLHACIVLFNVFPACMHIHSLC